MHGLGRLNFLHQFFGHRVSIADQQIVVDGVERWLFLKRHVYQLRALHHFLPPPQAGRQPRLIACVFGKAQALLAAAGDLGETIQRDVRTRQRHVFGGVRSNDVRVLSFQ